MTRSALWILIPLLAACDMHSKSPASGDESVTINADASGRVEFDLPFVNGSVKLPEGAMGNSDFDIDGVRLMPGSTVTGFNVEAGDKGATVNFAFKAPASPENVRAYFVDQFRQKGVEAAAAGTSVSGKTKDGDPFVINVEPDAQGSKGKITIQDNS